MMEIVIYVFLTLATEHVPGRAFILVSWNGVRLSPLGTSATN
jgi:hypothetical protein